MYYVIPVTFSVIIIVKGKKVHIVSYHTGNGLCPQSIYSKKMFLELPQISGAQVPLLEKIQNHTWTLDFWQCFELIWSQQCPKISKWQPWGLKTHSLCYPLQLLHWDTPAYKNTHMQMVPVAPLPAPILTHPKNQFKTGVFFLGLLIIKDFMLFELIKRKNVRCSHHNPESYLRMVNLQRQPNKVLHRIFLVKKYFANSSSRTNITVPHGKKIQRIQLRILHMN